MQELVQDFVDDIMSAESLLLETDPEKRKELLEDIVKDKSVDFALGWCEDNPEKVEKELEKVFGKDYGDSQITGQSISDGIKSFNEWEDVIDIAGNIASFIDAYGDYKFSDSDSLGDKEDALAAMTSSMLDICNTVVSKVPYIGPTLSLIVQQLSKCFDMGYNIISSHLDQLRYVDAMHEYYACNISTNELKSIFEELDGVKKSEIKQLKALARMESHFSESERQKYYEENNYAGQAEVWKTKGYATYNNLSEKEREEYGKDTWKDDTGEEQKKNQGTDLDNAGDEEPPRDPLVIDLNGDDIDLKTVDQGVYFDLDNDGISEMTGWIGSEDEFFINDIENFGLYIME